MKKKFWAILSAAMMFSVMGAGSAGAAPAKAVPTENHITLKSGSVNVYDYGDVKLHAYFTNDPLADVAYIVEGKEALAGVDFEVIDRGESYDLAIPSLNVIYTHMLGKTTHSILTSAAHIEAFLQMLKEYQAAGYAMILTSHGGPEGQDAVAEKISYLNKTKEIMQQSKIADEFKANMKAAFPAYDGENYLDMTAGFLYK